MFYKELKTHNFIKMRTQSLLFSLIVFFGLGCAAQAQQVLNSPGKISIHMSSTEQLPADLIVFNINLNAEGSTPREAFGLHKERETLLADLLKKFNLKEEDIKYQPIRINKRYRDNGKSMVSTTNQQVSVTFSDFDIYEEIQLTLIENNFDSFSGSFSSSKMAEGKDRALISAIDAAKKRALTIAKASGVELGEVITISYSDYQISAYKSGYDVAESRLFSEPSSMMDFGQTVGVTASISIDFSIKK